MHDFIKIDFKVLDTKDPRFIAIKDFSKWGSIVNRPAKISVITPGATKPVEHYWTPMVDMILSSSNLGLSCMNCDEVDYSDLPDGFYEITITGSPSKYSKTHTFFKTDLIQLELDRLFVERSLNCEDDMRSIQQKDNEIRLLLKAAEANVRYDNICKARELYDKAEKKLNNYKNCKSCVGATVR